MAFLLYKKENGGVPQNQYICLSTDVHQKLPQ
jgi:hypothetical protein